MKIECVEQDSGKIVTNTTKCCNKPDRYNRAILRNKTPNDNQTFFYPDKRLIFFIILSFIGSKIDLSFRYVSYIKGSEQQSGKSTFWKFHERLEQIFKNVNFDIPIRQKKS